MPTLETLTLPDLKKTLKSSSLNKGYSYLNRIQNATRTGQTLTAEVMGSRRYELEIEATPGGLVARCSCPYDWGGYCKHIAGVLLKWVESPGSFIVKEPDPAAGPAAALPVFPVEPPPTQKPKTRPFWVAESADDRQQRDLTKLKQALEQLKIQDLRDIAKKRGWTLKGTGKADLARQISETITRPDEIEKGQRSLDGEHRQALRALVLLGHEEGFQVADIERVAKVWGKLKSYKQVTTYTRHLSEAGLALPAETMGLYGLEADVVPRPIARQLPPVLAEVIPSHATRPPDPQADELRLADSLALVRLANQITLLLEQSPPPLRTPMPRPRLEKFFPALAEWDYDPAEILELSQRNNLQPYTPDVILTMTPPAWSLPDETVARLAPIAGDETRLEFIFALLAAAGLFQPGSPVTIWPEMKEQYLRQTEAAQHAILARVYFLMLNWSELWDLLRADTALHLRRGWNYPYVKPANLSAELTRFRQLILRALSCLPDGEWVALDDLRPLLRALWPRFDGHAVPQYYGYGAKPTWFLTHQGRDLKPDNEQDWQTAQGAFIRQMISGPLHWLGLADLSLKNGVLVAARFHGLADLYWDRVETPASLRAVATTPALPPAEAVKMDESGITVDPTAISAQAHGLLDQIARLDQAVPGRFVYRLDAQAAHQSFEKGVALADILHDWERFLAIPLPPNLRHQLEAWWRAYGQVRIYQEVTLIEFGDDYALTEMKAVTSLERHLIAELSPRLALIPKAAVEPLTAELEKAGYTPKQTDDVL